MTTSYSFDVDKLNVVNGTYYHTEDVVNMLRHAAEVMVRGAKANNRKVEFYEYTKELHIRYSSGDCKATVDEEHHIDESGKRHWNMRMVVTLSRRNKLHSSTLALLGNVGANQQTVPEGLVRSMCVDFAMKMASNRHVLMASGSGYGVRAREEVMQFFNVHMPVAPIIRIEDKVESSSRKAARKAMLTERVNRGQAKLGYLEVRLKRMEEEVGRIKDEMEKLTTRLKEDNDELTDM